MTLSNRIRCTRDCVLSESMVTFRRRDRSKSPEQGDELDRLNRRVRELEALNRLAGLIGSTMEVDKILKIIVDEAIVLTDATQGSISIVDEEAPSGMTTLVRGEQSELHGITFKVDRSLTGWVLHNREVLLVEDLCRDHRFPGFRGKDYKMKTVLSVPLISKGRVVGAINLCNKRGGPFTADDVRLVSIFSSQSAQIIESARLFEKVSRENIFLKKEVRGRYQFEGIIGQSPSMGPVFALLEHIVSSEANVVLQGESGTGKELLARAIHYNGPRREGPFVPVECGAIPESLLESELFGYVRGAFTGAVKDKPGLFQQASGGTLFLDEITNMGPTLQSKLLRALQEREIRPVGATVAKKIDVRIISASSKNLKDLVAQGIFREDLFYRLNVVTVNIPPLRNRKEDIPSLADHFLNAFRKVTGKKLPGFSSEAMRLLELYHWPGNVRELKNVVERAVALSSVEDEQIGPSHLPEEILHTSQLPPLSTEGKTLKNILQEVKHRAIVEALEKHGDNRTKAAQVLGVSRQGLIKMLKEMGI